MVLPCGSRFRLWTKAVAVPLLLLAQLPGQVSPTFEVATVKRAKGDEGVRGYCNAIDSGVPAELRASAPPLGRCVITNATLYHLLAIAYEFRYLERIKGGPSWAREDGIRFNVEAKAEDPSKATNAQLSQMLRALLIERFHIQWHLEEQDVPGFALVVAKGGPKLREAKDEEDPYFKVVSGHPMTLSARKYAMARFAAFLDMRRASGPVVDRTGLTGAYDFTLSWDERDGLSLVTVLGELGLRLESRKLPESFLVIEAAEKPGEN
jgi:uncharacterized protein (TIGR03435 family)